MQRVEKIKLNENEILTKALEKLTNQLQLSRQELMLIVGPSEPTLCRYFNPNNHSSYLDPSSKEGEVAILLIRIYKSLDVLFGGNIEQSRLWLRNKNQHLDGIPIDLMKSIEGIVKVVQYLDAIRGKN